MSIGPEMTRKRSTNGRGRHVLESGRRSPLRGLGPRVTPGRIAASAAAVLVGVLGAAGAAAGSYAYLNAAAPVGTTGATITAGTSALTLQSGAGVPSSTLTLPATVWNRMLPGDVAGQTVTVANTGDTQLAVSARLSATSAWGIRIASGSCPSSQIAGAALGTTSSAWTTLAAGASATLCIQAALPGSAAASTQGTSPATTLLLDGVQTS